MFLAVFIINPVHINSHHVSSRIVEGRFCCRNIFVQLWRVNFDSVKTEKNVRHRTDWCHVHNRSFANPLILNKLDESGRLLGSSAWEGLIEWRMMSRAHTLVSHCSWQMMMMTRPTRSIILKRWTHISTARAARVEVFLTAFVSHIALFALF